jgi:molybdopterin synthase sulfur carrier subunit
MSIKVRIPTPLRKLTKDQEVIELNSCTSISQLIDSLETTYPGIRERLCDEKGEVRRFINVYLNDEDIRFLKNKETSLKAGDEVSIVPAIAGG